MIGASNTGSSKFLGVSGETSVVTELPLSFGLRQYWKRRVRGEDEERRKRRTVRGKF